MGGNTDANYHSIYVLCAVRWSDYHYPPKPQEGSIRIAALIPGMLPAAMAPPEVSFSATIPAIVEELFPDDFQTVETEGHHFPGLDEQSRSISY